MKVSCIIPFYNSGKYLVESVDSIIKQTYSDFELILVDDSSTDDSGDIARDFAKKDSRVKVIHNGYKKGIVGARNTGLDLAVGEYVANMDSDDISLPTRFEKQVDFLDKNPDIGVLGTSMQEFGDSTYLWPTFSSPEGFKVYFILYPTIWNPTAMYRKSIVDKYGIRYRVEYEAAEDADFWLRMMDVTQFAGIKEALVKYRIHKESMSVSKWGHQVAAWRKVVSRLFERIGIHDPSNELFEILVLYDIEDYEGKDSQWKERAFKDLDRLLKANCSSKVLNQQKLEKLIADIKVFTNENVD